jgi:hypothetical protein
MMDPVFGGLNPEDTLAIADPLAVLVLLGAVAGAVSLSVTRGINTCPAEASGNQPPGADDFLTAWLDSLLIPSFHR